MIEIIEGRGVGAGKSYYVVTRVIKHVVAGGTVFYSDTLQLLPEKIAEHVKKRFGLILEEGQMVAVSKEDVWRIHEVTPPGTDEMPVLIILDEVQRALNARDWADKSKRALFDWACESRHDSNDLMFISQNALNIDKQVARLATYQTRVRNMAGFKFGGFAWPFKQFLIHVFDGDGKTSMEKKLIWHDKEIFACYTSKSMKGAHRRLLADAIPKRKLQKTKPKKHMKFLIIIMIAIVCGAGTLAYRIYDRGGVPGLIPGKGSTATGNVNRQSVVASGAVPAASPIPKWKTLSETFKGSMPHVLRTLEGGDYIEGEMSKNGFVEIVKGNIAKLKGPLGEVIYIVARDPVLAKQ